jgi:hypothetical protein
VHAPRRDLDEPLAEPVHGKGMRGFVRHDPLGIECSGVIYERGIAFVDLAPVGQFMTVS